MTPFVDDVDFTLYCGDALDVLRGLPDESVHCALTSPPFYALRDYGVEGQIGLEATPDEWASRLVDVFREVRRVLRSDGTLWVECGDSYAQYDGQGYKDDPRAPGLHGAFRMSSRLASTAENRSDRHSLPSGYKRKDLIGGPWLLAFALRADGWYLRQSIVWHKPNAMPESATDRCTTAHSYVFLMSKSARYHFDAEAIAEPAEWARWGDQTVPKYEGTDTASGWMQPKSKREIMALADHRYDGLVGQKWKKDGRDGNGQRERTDEMRGFDERRDRADGLKNPRSVWTIPTQGYPDAHFATWPEALCERIIKAGCPEGGVCLDPFMGSGTTALVARKLGRRSIGIELSPEYAELCARRLQQLSLFGEAA